MPSTGPASSSHIFDQYLGVAAGGNVKVHADMGKGVHLRCKKCSAVYILGETALLDYSKIGTLEEKVQEFVKTHRHKDVVSLWNKPGKAKPLMKVEVGKLWDWNKPGGYIDFKETPKLAKVQKQTSTPREIKTEGRKFRCDD